MASAASSRAEEQSHKQPGGPSEQQTTLEPYTLGQFSYAPATQTTVITTTTTTTTSFPPLLMKTRQPLDSRDPKQFPLAFSPTPQALKHFQFDVDGRPAYFQEAEDVKAGLEKVRMVLAHETLPKSHFGDNSTCIKNII